MLDERTIAFADFRGNKQYISAGNVSEDDRVALIFVDYPHRLRLKVLAHAAIVTKDSDARVFTRVTASPDTENPGAGSPERVFVLKVAGLDWNCPQYITPRFTEAEVQEMARPLFEKVDALERENEELRAQLARKG